MSNAFSSRKVFLPLFLVIFIDSMGYGLIIPVLLRLIATTGHDFNISHFNEAIKNLIYGIGIALSPFAYLIAAPIVGSWSDKLGRRKTLLICLSASCVGFVLPVIGVLTSSLLLIFIGRFLAGAASSSQPIAQAAITDISHGTQKAFYLSMITFAMTLAMVTGPVLGSYLSDSSLVAWFNMTTPFAAAALLVLLSLVLIFFFFNETHQQTASSLLSLQETVTALTSMFSNKNVRLLLLVFFVYEFAWSLYFQDISLFLSLAYHYSVNQTALFMAYIGFWMSLGLTVLYRYVIRYLSLANCLLGCLIIATLGFTGCTWMHSHLAQWIFLVPVSITIGMAYPTLLAMISDRVSTVHQGWVMGAAGSMLALSWMLSGVITSALTNIGLRLPLQVTTVAALVSVLILIIYPARAVVIINE